METLQTESTMSKLSGYIVLIYVACGVAFFAFSEGVEWTDALYLSTVTMTTVGYGDLAPTTDASKAFAIGYILLGLSLVATCIGVIIGGLQGTMDAAASTGVSKRLIREMVNYALERKQFGKPIMEHQMIQAMIADSQAETYAAECMIMDAARRRDAGEDVTLLASSTKLFATEACGRVADRAVQVFGGAGYVSDYGIERFYRDVRIFRLYEGTSQIQQIIIARELARAAKKGTL